MIKKRVDHGGKGWCTAMDDVQWWWPGLKERGIFDAIVARKSLLDFFDIVLSTSVSLVPFPFSTLLCSFIVHFFSPPFLLYLARKKRGSFYRRKDDILFIFSLYLFSILLRFFVFREYMCDIGTVNNIEFSLNFSIGIQFYFPFSYFLVLARENHNNILSFFFFHSRKEDCRVILLYIFLFQRSVKLFHHCSSREKFEAKKYSRPPEWWPSRSSFIIQNNFLLSFVSFILP